MHWRLWLTVAFLAFLAASGAGAQSTAQISGVVYDSIRHEPLRRALVIATLAGAVHDTTFHAAEADDKGRFQIDALRPGNYTLSVEHPFIDSTGIPVPSVEVNARAGANATALGVPSVATLRRTLCSAAVADTTLGIMLGTVRRLDGSVVPGADLVFRWADFQVDRATLQVISMQMGASVKTDAAGVFRACGLPRTTSLFVQALVDSVEQSGLLEERIGETSVLLREFRVSRPTDAVAATETAGAVGTAPAMARGFVVSGRVEGARGERIASAQVTLLGAEKTTTVNESGEFRIVGAPGGTQGLEVLALGYAPRYVRVDVGPGNPPLSVRMDKSAAILDSVRIVARRNYSSGAARYREFETRAKHSDGHIFGEEEIASRNPLRSTDLMRLVPGIIIKTAGFNTTVLSSRGAGFSSVCAMRVFLDGMEMKDWNPDDLPPIALHGMEVYESSTNVPAKYRNGSSCGAVLLWTK